MRSNNRTPWAAFFPHTFSVLVRCVCYLRNLLMTAACVFLCSWHGSICLGLIVLVAQAITTTSVADWHLVATGFTLERVQVWVREHALSSEFYAGSNSITKLGDFRRPFGNRHGAREHLSHHRCLHPHLHTPNAFRWLPSS